jgi:hypothetical protein
MKGWLIAVLALASAPAIAGGRLAVPANPAWQAECASCHIAYPPQLLPAASWKRLMSQLDRHFGADASVDAATAAKIDAFLEAHAGRGAGEPLRITETAWFRHEHRRATAGNPASCESCHTTAAAGDFRERNIRLPR